MASRNEHAVTEAASLSGAGQITADGLLRRRAQQKPQSLALLDPPNRQKLTFVPPYRLTYAEADAAVDAMAAGFADLGLVPGDRVVLQLPNLVEMPLALLGAWRAGLIVAAIPMLWRATEIARVCDSLEPSALIGISKLGGTSPAKTLQDVAATRLPVRFVLGFGPNLPAGVICLNNTMPNGTAASRAFRFSSRSGTEPALITFTARENAPLVPLFRKQDEILAQGAMAVLALSLDHRDAILNAFPFTGPIGLGTGLAPWLIGGASLIQHDPFDHGVFVQQVLTTGATTTALPSAVLRQLAQDGIFEDRNCRLHRVGRVWSIPELDTDPSKAPARDGASFDLYPLGDLASLLLRVEDNADRASLPRGQVCIGNDDRTPFVETRVTDNEQVISIRGPVVPVGWPKGPVAADAQGFVSTGLHGQPRNGRLRLTRNPALVYHGGFTIAASELDGLYQAFPDYLDAACFVLPDPVVGDRIFGAVAPGPGSVVSLEALHRFLAERCVAPYKFPDKILVVKDIPRGPAGEILREEILLQL